MKEIKEVADDKLTNMFSKEQQFNKDISAWTVTIDYNLSDLNAKQLLVVQIMDLEICKRSDRVLFIQISDIRIQSLLSDLETIPDKSKDQLSKIPNWIKRLFKAT